MTTAVWLGFAALVGVVVVVLWYDLSQVKRRR